MLNTKAAVQAITNISFPRRSIPASDIGLMTAKYLWRNSLKLHRDTDRNNTTELPINRYANEYITGQVQSKYPKKCH